ncbi:MAG: YbaB/EbfC family nucleoid-associated protein [Nitrospinota bacterium]
MMPRNLGSMMKQAQKLQADLQRLQDELGDRTVEGTAGGGMVKAVVTGKQDVVSIEIEKEVVDPEDVEMLQDLVTAAVNEALRKAREMVSGEMAKLTGGINIPGMM